MKSSAALSLDDISFIQISDDRLSSFDICLNEIAYFRGSSFKGI